jgi:hypothetical protein
MQGLLPVFRRISSSQEDNDNNIIFEHQPPQPSLCFVVHDPTTLTHEQRESIYRGNLIYVSSFERNVQITISPVVRDGLAVVVILWIERSWINGTQSISRLFRPQKSGKHLLYELRSTNVGQSRQV